MFSDTFSQRDRDMGYPWRSIENDKITFSLPFQYILTTVLKKSLYAMETFGFFMANGRSRLKVNISLLRLTDSK